MSDDAPKARPDHHKRLGDIAEGITFVIFIAMITTGQSSPLATPITLAAVLWTIISLAFPLFWRGAFTFAIPRSATQQELDESDVAEPRLLSVLGFMPFVLGMDGVRAFWGPHFFLGLAYAALLAGPLFATVYAIDPPMRTTKQMVYLAVAALLWGLGTVAAILGLFFG